MVAENLIRLEKPSDEDFSALRDELFLNRMEYGYHKYSPTRSQMGVFAFSIAHQEQISKYMESILFFMEGLSSNGVLSVLKLDRKAGEYALTYHDELLSIERVKSLFRPHFHPEDANKREIEEDIYACFTMYLEEASIGKGVGVDVQEIDDVEAGLPENDIRVS